ncbi:hypothetical protein [Ascidiimonas aurantiaca]|uniref:hypothetical protein n=1 Tax=Ascidiimonas aurantiaca TaxID=1685432 RepID=UPI0030ED5789
MLLKKTNIEEKLQRYQSAERSQVSILEQVRSILEEETRKQDNILKNLEGHTATAKSINEFIFDDLDTDRIYHIDTIKQICIDYRLRFLDTRYFKGKYPQEALLEITRLEKTHNTQLGNFKIMAPSKLFKLENADDPLLFVPLGNKYYYLVHKWGNDLHPLRKWLMLPFKNFLNLTILIFLISWLLTEMIPAGLFSKEQSLSNYMVIYFFMFKSIAGVVLFYGFALGKNFNHAIWNSKYFNA